MSFRVIHLPLFGHGRDTAAIAAAFSVAHRFESAIDAFFPRLDPSEVVPFIGEGISPAVIQQLSDAAREETDRQRATARDGLEAACADAGVALGERHRPDGARSVRWIEATGDRADLVVRQARLADLTFFTLPAEDDATIRGIVEGTLLGSGRPIVVVPNSWTGSLGHTPAIAWNGGIEATRAVAAAMPFLEAAVGTHVLTAATGKTRFEASADLAAYLDRHGVSVERHAVHVDGVPVGEALLRQAVAAQADLLVLGGYSRSRFREMVLGGVTHHVLAHASLPVMLVH